MNLYLTLYLSPPTPRISVNVVGLAADKAVYANLTNKTNGIWANISVDFVYAIAPFLDKLDTEIVGGYLVRLSSYEVVELKADPRLGDKTVDSDNDDLSDLAELIREEPRLIYVGNTSYNVNVWTFKSNPAVEDSDGDGIWDDEELVISKVHPLLEGTKTYSNPLSKDTDGDGINDFCDPFPQLNVKYSGWNFIWHLVDMEEFMRKRKINELVMIGVQEVLGSGDYHSCIMIFVNSKSQHYSMEYFNKISNNSDIKYITLGAGPAWGLNADPLTSDFNRPNDVKFDNKVQMINLTTSGNVNSRISDLIECHEYYRKNPKVDYILFPNKNNEFNSNSYAKGLLNASGISDLGGPNYKVPGYKYPLPSKYFGR